MIQARAPLRPAAHAGFRRRAAVAHRAIAKTSSTTTLSPPPPLPSATNPPPATPTTLRQLYPFVPDAAAAAGVASPRQQQAPAPLLAGMLPAAASDGDGDGDDANGDDDPDHRFFFEVRGNPLGLPALVLHGGPGAGSYPSHARFFDPERFCVVLFDQRGCGRSSPVGALRNNTARLLLRDAERLRAHLGVREWACVLGGSWGSALGIEYAVRYPQSVRALVLRAVCSMRPREEIGWLYRGGGAGALRPQAWRSFLAHVGMTPERVAAGVEDPLPAYYERLLSTDDLARRDAAASAWMAWEWAVYSTRAEDEPLLAAEDAAAPVAPLPLPADLLARGLAFPGVAGPNNSPTRADYTAAQALLLCHYSLHGGFLNEPSPLLERVAEAAASGRLSRVSLAAFHGAADAVCPPRNARALRAVWPRAKIEVLSDAVGHSMYDPALVDAVVRATDAAADAADGAALNGAAPLRARKLAGLIESERQRRDAEVASAASALTRA